MNDDRKFSAQEVERVRSMLRKGVSQREIARTLNRPRTSVQRVIQRLGAENSVETSVPKVEQVSTDRPVVAPIRTAARQTFGFVLTPSVQMVEEHGGVDRYVAEVVQRIGMPGWRVSVRKGEDDRYQALMLARASAKERGADLVVYDRDRLIVSERPPQSWDRTPEELIGDAYIVIPVVVTPT